LTEYKVLEVSTVTDEELTRVLNEGARAGWTYDGIQFAMRESSKRPAMAFVVFTRNVAEEEDTVA
jgi:hypothetical protein